MPAGRNDDLPYWRARCVEIFQRRHVDRQSHSAIARAIGASVVTVRRVLAGESHPDQTVDLRERWGSEPSRHDRLTLDEIAQVYQWFHRERISLARIGQRLGGVDPSEVRAALAGTGPYEDVEAALPGRWPKYQPRSGRGAIGSVLSDRELVELFAAYWDRRLSLADAGKVVGRGRESSRELLTGAAAAEQTVELRARYGSTVRRRGRPSRGDT